MSNLAKEIPESQLHNSRNYLKNKHLNMTQKWSEIQIKEIYTVTNTRIVDTKNENGKYIIFYCTQ